MNQFKEHEIEWNDAKVGRLWNYYSKTPPYKGNYFSQGSGGYVLKLFIEHNNIENPTILDFGGGKGFMFEHSKKHFKSFKYYNADFSKDSIDASRERLKNNNEFVDALHIESLPIGLADNSIDIIYLIEVLEHLNDEYLKGTLKEIYRLLKPGGKLVLTTPNDEDLSLLKNFCPDCGCVYHKWQHVRTVNSDNVLSILYEFDFSEIKFYEKTFRFESKSFFKKNILKINHLISKQKNENLVCIATKK